MKEFFHFIISSSSQLEFGNKALIKAPMSESSGFTVEVTTGAVPVDPLHLYIRLTLSMSFLENPSRCPIFSPDDDFASIVGFPFFENAFAE